MVLKLLMIRVRVPLVELHASCSSTGVSIQNAAAVADAKSNGYFRRFTKDKVHTKGMFYQFCPEIRQCLLQYAIAVAPTVVSTNREDLDNQREAKRKKEEMMEQRGMMKAKESTIEASYYWEMYNKSDACWKNIRTMKTMLGRLSSESTKLEALKENIRMRVIGLGWTQFAITWSSKGKKRSVVEFTDHMKMIIKEEKKLTPPTDPAIQLPTRKELPVLGTATQQLIDSNETAQIDVEQFRKEVAGLRQQRGEGSIYSALQPLVCPEPDELVDKRIDVLYSFQLTSDGDKALRWCQGKVIEVITDQRVPTVRVC